MRAYLIDIDDTLSDPRHRRHHLTSENKDWPAFYAGMADDPPHRDICDMVEALAVGSSYAVFFVTGRPDSYRETTERWLQDHVSTAWHKSEALLMREKGDYRLDTQVKADMLEGIMGQGYTELVAIDNRQSVVDMWRSNGVRCMQVAPGDFDRDMMSNAQRAGEDFVTALEQESKYIEAVFGRGNEANLAALGEEFGEVCNALIEMQYGTGTEIDAHSVFRELVQVGAVAHKISMWGAGGYDYAPSEDMLTEFRKRLHAKLVRVYRERPRINDRGKALELITELEQDIARKETEDRRRGLHRIKIADDYPYPAGRYRTDGPQSAEAFREDVLIPALGTYSTVLVSFYDLSGASPSWIEEVFGGLVRKGIISTIDEFDARITVENPNFTKKYALEAKHYVREAISNK